MEKYFDAVISHATGINCKTYDRHFALEQAAISRNPYFVKTLLERGANPNLKNNWGATALHRAVECCNFAVIPLLLQADTDTTIADRHGLTALNMAEESDIHEIIKMFDDDAERRKQEQKLRIKKIAADSITVKEDIVPPTVTLSPVRRQMKL
jgi:ankyrin repeat protein